MGKIELTKEEVEAVLNTLSEMRFREVAGLIQFFNNKLNPITTADIKNSKVK